MTEIVLIVAMLLTLGVDVLLWRHVETLFSAVAKLANAQAASETWSTNEAKDVMALSDRVDAVEKVLDDLPLEQMRENADKEADFLDGLNGILSYNIDGYGLNKDGVKHE